MTPRRGEIWSLDGATEVLVVSSTVYNEIASEPTVVVVPVFSGEPAVGFGVPLGNNRWAAPGFITSARKRRLGSCVHDVGIQALADVNNMLFKILATPDR